jgi:arsenate reductase (thioredoxin)
MSETILFLCPHHAAKSVIAAAYFNRLAKEHQLPYIADSAGTEPDAAVNPKVAEMLLAEGIDVTQHQPRRVTKDELEQAERVISMGCIAEELELAPERIDDWSDVPMVSKDLAAARDAIQAHVEALVAELRNEQP